MSKLSGEAAIGVIAFAALVYYLYKSTTNAVSNTIGAVSNSISDTINSIADELDNSQPMQGFTPDLSDPIGGYIDNLGSWLSPSTPQPSSGVSGSW
jgi:hypothetical protein